MGYAYLVHNSDVVSEQIRDAGQQIMNAAETGSALTCQLLAFSCKQVMVPKVIDLGEITAGLGKMIPRVLGEDVDVRIVQCEGLKHVTTEPRAEIKQIIMNLVVNARDAMPNGGKLIIETSNVHFDESEARHHDVPAGDYVLLAVTDTGEGMSNETRARIFEPFFTTKAMGKGTGLGLATVYGIVGQSRGHILVYSELGQGTSFKIYLPATATPAATAALPVDRQELIACGSETLLLVEDQEALREMLTHILRSKGYTVLSANGGPDAMRQMAQHNGNVQLLITDVIMPEMRGSTLAKALTARHPNLLVIYMSGYTDNALIQSDSLPEDMVFLQKPFPPDVMLNLIREVLDRAATRQWEQNRAV